MFARVHVCISMYANMCKCVYVCIYVYVYVYVFVQYSC